MKKILYYQKKTWENLEYFEFVCVNTSFLVYFFDLLRPCGTILQKEAVSKC